MGINMDKGKSHFSFILSVDKNEESYLDDIYLAVHMEGNCRIILSVMLYC